jgi:hypothetical protein
VICASNGRALRDISRVAVAFVGTGGSAIAVRSEQAVDRGAVVVRSTANHASCAATARPSRTIIGDSSQSWSCRIVAGIPKPCVAVRILPGAPMPGAPVHTFNDAGHLPAERPLAVGLPPTPDTAAAEAVVAVAERLGLIEIATVDRRHFGVVRPRQPSAHQAVDVGGADPDLVVVLLAQRDVVEDVEGAVRVAVLVKPDQRPGHVERDAHRLVVLVGDQGV